MLKIFFEFLSLLKFNEVPIKKNINKASALDIDIYEISRDISLSYEKLKSYYERKQKVF